MRRRLLNNVFASAGFAMLALMGSDAIGRSAVKAQAASALPAGSGSEIVRAKCLGCHEADLITQQRLVRAGWIRELEKMERWGAALTADERSTAADYLSRHFARATSGSILASGVMPTASSPASATATSRAASASTTADEPGRIALEKRCITCHEADIITQQRLDRAGWGRELDKMVRWGAVITDAERGDLTTYLTDRYGRR
ncbi:MAG: hypothetical protein QM736_24675 [Vicinamibacterales bacterium]